MASTSKGVLPDPGGRMLGQYWEGKETVGVAGMVRAPGSVGRWRPSAPKVNNPPEPLYLWALESLLENVKEASPDRVNYEDNHLMKA